MRLKIIPLLILFFIAGCVQVPEPQITAENNAGNVGYSIILPENWTLQNNAGIGEISGKIGNMEIIGNITDITGQNITMPFENILYIGGQEYNPHYHIYIEDVKIHELNDNSGKYLATNGNISFILEFNLKRNYTCTGDYSQICNILYSFRIGDRKTQQLLEEFFPVNLTYYNRTFLGIRAGQMGGCDAFIGRETEQDNPGIIYSCSSIRYYSDVNLDLKTGNIIHSEWDSGGSTDTTYIFPGIGSNSASYVEQIESIHKHLDSIKNNDNPQYNIKSDPNPELQESMDYLSALLQRLQNL